MVDNKKPVLVEPIKTGTTSEKDELAHLAVQAEDGRPFRMEEDFTSKVNEAIPIADELAKTDVDKAVDSLVSLEKKSRQGNDAKSNARLLRHMIKLCFEGQKWNLLNETILSLSKKRLIIKVAIAKMVRDACDMVEKLPTEELRNNLITTLRDVTAGKLYVEVERAHLTSRVVKQLESEGKLDEATNLLLDLQVETYGSMETQEKVEYLLEQMRMCLARNDFTRASIISKKVSTKFFNSEKESVQDLKIKYYNLMILIGLTESNYLDVCRHYRYDIRASVIPAFRAMYETPKIKDDKEKAKIVLRCAVLYCILSKHSNEQWDLLNRIAITRDLEQIPEYKALVELFITQEIISWKNTMEKEYERYLLKGTPVFSQGKDAVKRWQDLHMRVAEHNLRMISKYYVQITFDRLAEHLDMPVAEAETFLCDMIVSGAIPGAKLHRPERIVNLRARKAPVEELDQWANNVAKLTTTLNKVSHLILKEQMVHRTLDLSK